MQRCAEVNEQTPMWDDVSDAFNLKKKIAYVERL